MPPPGEERVYLQEGRKEEVFLHVSRDRRRQKRHLSDHDLPPIYPHLTRDVITRTQKASNSGGKKKKTGDKEEQAEQEPRNRQESFWS
jgi:hypothetical protein